jgi:hypothetical protein
VFRKLVKRWRSLRIELKVAWIGFAGLIVAAIIGGIVAGIFALVAASESGGHSGTGSGVSSGSGVSVSKASGTPRSSDGTSVSIITFSVAFQPREIVDVFGTATNFPSTSQLYAIAKLAHSRRWYPSDPTRPDKQGYWQTLIPIVPSSHDKVTVSAGQIYGCPSGYRCSINGKPQLALEGPLAFTGAIAKSVHVTSTSQTTQTGSTR